MSAFALDRLRGQFPDRSIEYFPSLDSTMVAAAGRPLGSVVVAGEQTAGQGRHGHSWHSIADDGLYCSLVLRPAPVLTLALGLAAAEAIAAVTGFTCDLRWPNDLLAGRRKLGGILVQLSEGVAIAGIGINLNQRAFSGELEAVATSLFIETGRAPDPADLLAALIRSVDHLAAMDKDSVLRLFTQASSYVTGRRVTVQQPDGILLGTTAGLDADGFLKLRKDDGTETAVLAGGVRAIGA